tara:strand:- start:451 stop:654 length:204 start_codon:yes stop_codon:yes gene_type:complete
MAFEKLRGYFYNSDGELLEYYLGYGDLNNINDLLEFRKNCIGFVSTEKSYNTESYKFDLETNTVIEK